MKIELPDNHPLAEAIREHTSENWEGSELFLSLDRLTANGTAIRLLSYRIDAWSKITTTHFEFNGIDVNHSSVMPD